MTDGLVFFRSKTTGKTGYYPAHFRETWPDFEEVDPSLDFCVDCVVTPAPVEPVATKVTTTVISKEGVK